MHDVKLLNELIKKLEACQGPDRELDGEIAVAVLGGDIVWLSANGTMDMYPVRRYASTTHVTGVGNAPILCYTSSLDAARQLVPVNHSWRIESLGYAVVLRAALNWRDQYPEHKAYGYTPETALCAAAIKAHVAFLQQHGS